MDEEERVRLWRITDIYDRFLQNRIEIVACLFAADHRSIDAVILGSAVLTGIAYWRYREVRPRLGNQPAFERLLLEYSTTIQDRTSIVEATRCIPRSSEPDRQQVLDAIRECFPVAIDGTVRQIEMDPTRSEWENFLSNRGLRLRDPHHYSYIRLLFRYFRNSVQHELRFANGREALPFGPFSQTPFFYTNHGLNAGIQGVRWGFDHPALEQILRDVVASVRSWAVREERDIFGSS